MHYIYVNIQSLVFHNFISIPIHHLFMRNLCIYTCLSYISLDIKWLPILYVSQYLYIFYHLGEFHEVVLENLEPATAYQYRVSLTTPSSTETVSKPSGNYTVVNKPRYLSKSYRFVSSPGVGPDIPANIFAFGDLGIGMPFNSDVEQQPPSVETVRNMRNVLDSQPDTPALVMHIGDISYARGYAFLWDVFMRQIEPVASQAPWMISLGNVGYYYISSSSSSSSYKSFIFIWMTSTVYSYATTWWSSYT